MVARVAGQAWIEAKIGKRIESVTRNNTWIHRDRDWGSIRSMQLAHARRGRRHDAIEIHAL